MSMEFKLKFRRTLRDPLTSVWLPWEKMKELITPALDENDLYKAIEYKNIKLAECYLEIIRIVGEYLIDRPNPDAARYLYMRVKLDFNYANSNAHDSMWPKTDNVLKIGQECIRMAEIAAKKCGIPV